MSTNIDDDKLRTAKEKLACHIQPPHAQDAQAAMVSDRVRLTQMTSAGG